MLYFVKRLLYDIFLSGSRKKKFFVLILLLFVLLLFRSGVLAEEVEAPLPSDLPIETIEPEPTIEPAPTLMPSAEPTTPPAEKPEPTPIIIIQTPEPTPEATLTPEELEKQEQYDNVLNYLNERAVGQSQSAYTYGYLARYRYYVIGSSSDDYRATQYLYLFDEYTSFSHVTDSSFDFTGEGRAITINSAGEVIGDNKFSGSAAIPITWRYVYSNIPGTSYPAVYQIDKEVNEVYEKILQIFVIVSVLLVGSYWLNIIINGGSKRGV
jgi:hypothetical protein